jgi:superfamily II DNA/RNA helicase
MSESQSQPQISSEEIALQYLDNLPWPAYPFQEQAILSWFEDDDGLLVCAPTGTGKTAIAETAMYEALMTGRRAYYTTPLIALTEQKFHELREAAVRWGFSQDHIGLVTGNRKVNPDAPILVVVAEILLNRLLEQRPSNSPHHTARDGRTNQFPLPTPGGDGEGPSTAADGIQSPLPTRGEGQGEGGSTTTDGFSFDDVSAVVMDEFHSFNDRERGIVWELSLGLLPKHVRVLLISATVGNAPEFVVWLNRQHGRRLRLLQSTERRVPLNFRWIPDELLPDQLELMAEGEEENRYTPALVFCFNRSGCWNVAEQIKGKRLLADGQQKLLQNELEKIDWSVGAGGKLKQILIRGVGIHHAGILPKYRRVIERLFQQKLLTICVCTETLAAGINLPARSVLMTSLIKGPPGRMKLIDASSAHQMFGRAGRPQFDNQGYVFAIAHEDDVRIHRWKEKYDAIPEDTRDPMLIRAKKKLKKKMPKRRDGQQYWTEKQFQTIREAPPAPLASRGRFPWRMLAFFIRKFGTVTRLQESVRRRLLDPDGKDDAEKTLKQMLLTLEAAGFVTLDPPPPRSHSNGNAEFAFTSRMADVSADLLQMETDIPQLLQSSPWLWQQTESDTDADAGVTAGSSPDVSAGFGTGVFANDGSQPGSVSADAAAASQDASQTEASEETADSQPGLLGQLIQEARKSGASTTRSDDARSGDESTDDTSGRVTSSLLDTYEPRLAVATETMPLLFAFRSVNSIYGVFVAEHLHRASHNERLQLLEAILNMPMSVGKMVRVPFPDRMPAGPLATEYLNPQLIARGIVTQEELQGFRDEETGRRIPPLTLADKMRSMFRAEFPDIHDFGSTAVWCVGDLLTFGGDFSKFVRARDLTKQEGVVFRHCLRMVLLCGEFAQIEPPGINPTEWRRDLAELASVLTASCRAVDPTSTDETLEQLASANPEPSIV